MLSSYNTQFHEKDNKSNVGGDFVCQVHIILAFMKRSPETRMKLWGEELTSWMASRRRSSWCLDTVRTCKIGVYHLEANPTCFTNHIIKIGLGR
jgi:hypothetical protein